MKKKKRFKRQHPHDKHALRRARMRYGAGITSFDIETMKEMIRGGRGKLLNIQSLSRRLYKLTYNGVVYYPVYAKTTRCIVTFLTERQAQKHV